MYRAIAPEPKRRLAVAPRATRTLPQAANARSLTAGVAIAGAKPVSPPGSDTIAAMRRRLHVACTLGFCALALSAGCERLLSIRDPVADDGPFKDDAPNDVGMDGGLGPSSPILLSEVVLTPSTGEMIEIVNTSNQEVDLSTYYLSDSGNYYRLPVQATVDASDFIVKFPGGAKIGGHEVLTVALDTPANFSIAYGRAPSFSLMDSSLDKIAMNGTATLTNGGEPIILFQWDGRSDLVRDVDIMLAGIPAGGNVLPDKSIAAPQDGPDPDTQPSQYTADANTIKAQPAEPAAGQSTKRLLLEDGHELHNGTGNGQSGDDETSEDISMTWDGTAASPFTAPTPGDVPPALKP